MKKVNQTLGQQLLMAFIFLIVNLFLQSCDTSNPFQELQPSSSTGVVVKEILPHKEKDFLKRVVVVCIKGYNPYQLLQGRWLIEPTIDLDSLDSEDKKELYSILKELEEKECKGFEKKDVNSLVGGIPFRGSKRIPFSRFIDSLRFMWDKLVKGNSGMKNLEGKLKDKLKPLGVLPENILLKEWTTNIDHSGNFAKQPEFQTIVDEIDKLQPSYLAIVGYSYGGCTSAIISNIISNKTGKKPDFVGLIDPIFAPVDIEFKFPIFNSSLQRSNESYYPQGNKIISWYQDSDLALRGFSNVLDSDRHRVNNRHINGLGHIIGHIKIADSSVIHGEIIDTIIADITRK